MCSQSFQLYTIHSNMKNKSQSNTIKVITYSQIISFDFYILLGVSSVIIYGNDIQANLIKDLDNNNLVNIGMSVLMLMILLVYSPPLLFKLKESLLILIDEYMRQSTSIILSKKAL